MSNLFIPYETGIPALAQEKGFDWPCIAFFPKYDIQNEESSTGNPIRQGSLTMEIQGGSHYGEDYYTKGINTTDKNSLYKLPAPTYQDLIDWFREKHKIVIHPNPSLNQLGELQFSFHVFSVKDGYCMFSTERDSDYYENLNTAIKDTFSLI